MWVRGACALGSSWRRSAAATPNPSKAQVSPESAGSWSFWKQSGRVSVTLWDVSFHQASLSLWPCHLGKQMILMRDGSLSPGTQRAHTAAIVLHCPCCPLEVTGAAHYANTHTKERGGGVTAPAWVIMTEVAWKGAIIQLWWSRQSRVKLAGLDSIKKKKKNCQWWWSGWVFEFTLPLQEARRGDLSEIAGVRQG